MKDNYLNNQECFASRKLYFSKMIFLSFFLLGSTLVYAQCDNWEETNMDAEWSARAGLQAVQQDGRFLILGGRTPRPPSVPAIPGDSDIWNDVWASDDKGNTWTKILDNDDTGQHWPARAYFQALTRNDSIFILGGQNYITAINPADSSLVSTSDFFNDVWVSPDGVAWQQLTDSAGWTGRAGLSSAVFNDEFYVMGGSLNDDAAVIGGPPQRIYYNDVWKSADGMNWELLTDSAAWTPRAGGIATVKDGYLYMIGGEEGFLCLPGSPCPPYYNDVWRTLDGVNWELVTDNAPWAARPGHQCVIADNQFVLFGGFGLDPNNPFGANNPIDAWVSQDGLNWEMLAAPPWNATESMEIKYDFDALVDFDMTENRTYIYSFGGDRETFNFADPTNYLNIDNDVWRFCVGNVVTKVEEMTPTINLKIFPNPSFDEVRVNSSERITKITLYNLSGERMETEVVSSSIFVQKIDVSSFPSGIYWLEIQVDGERLMEKFVKM